MSPEDRKRQIAVEFARAIGLELSSESAALCECDLYGALGEESVPYFEGLTQRGEDLVAKYIERAIQMDREGRSS